MPWRKAAEAVELPEQPRGLQERWIEAEALDKHMGSVQGEHPSAHRCGLPPGAQAACAVPSTWASPEDELKKQTEKETLQNNPRAAGQCLATEISW